MGRSDKRLDDLLRVIELAAAMGVPLVRLVVGTFTHWASEPPFVSVERLVPRVRTACRHAAELGIRLVDRDPYSPSGRSLGRTRRTG